MKRFFPRLSVLFFTLIMACSAFIQAEREDPAILQDLSRINASMRARTCVIQAQVLEYESPWSEKAPHTITVSDGSNRLPVVFWQDVRKGLAEDCMKIGARIEVRGTVNEYHGSFQIKVKKRTGHIRLLSPPPHDLHTGDEPTKKGALSSGTGDNGHVSILPTSRIPIGDIQKGPIGRIVTVAGEVTDFRSPWAERAPNKATLNDGSGSIIIVYWKEVAAGIPRSPELGDKIQVTGESQDYRGEQQIKVRNPRAIHFLEAGRDVTMKKTGASPTPKQDSTPEKIERVVTRGPSGVFTEWENSYSSALIKAGRNKRPIIIYFRKDGFQKCLEFEKNILMTDGFNQRARHFSCLYEDITRSQLLAYHFGIHRIPHIEILNSEGDRVACFSYNIELQSLVPALDKATINP